MTYYDLYKLEILVLDNANRETGNRNDTIRTCDPCFPKAVLYQTELHSVMQVPIAAAPEPARGTPQLNVSTEVIILLLVPSVKRFPVLPPILVNCPHTKDRNKDQSKPHHSKAPRSVHYTPNEQLNVVHRSMWVKDNL